jgi:hypothetical protein
MANTIYIACEAHGVAGAAVEYSHLKLQRDIKKFKKMATKEMARDLHAILARSLTAMLPDIMLSGTAVDAYGERYTQDTFDSDLVALAIYDHIGNDKQIALMMPRFGNLANFNKEVA